MSSDLPHSLPLSLSLSLSLSHTHTAKNEQGRGCEPYSTVKQHYAASPQVIHNDDRKVRSTEKLKVKRRNPLGFCYLEITFVNFLGLSLSRFALVWIHTYQHRLIFPKGNHLVV